MDMNKPKKNEERFPPSHLEKFVAGIFYKHGLFCASNPYLVIVLCGVVILTCSYPALTLFQSGMTSVAPIEYWPPTNGHDDVPPTWLSGGRPLVAVQQIVVATRLSSLSSSRGEDYGHFGESFNVSDVLRRLSFATRDGRREVGWKDVCLQGKAVEQSLLCNGETSTSKGECLHLSPDLIWMKDRLRFERDTRRKETIEQISKRAKCSLESFARPLLLGGRYGTTVVDGYQIFATTLFLNATASRAYEQFLDALKTRLETNYTVLRPSSPTLHALFVDGSTLPEMLSVVVMYVLVFLYISFSVGKIELVKSKWGLGLTAVITILCSLSVSLGLCTVLGIIPTLNGGEIFPFLVIFIGVENVLVLIKAVTSTSIYLDVNVRVAEGLSKEGFALTKNLLSELALFTVGYFTYQPVMQEFCLLAIIAFLCDFFLQAVFFPSVLSIDIRRLELSDASAHGSHEHKNAVVAPRSPTPNAVPNASSFSKKRTGGRVFAAFEQNAFLDNAAGSSVQTPLDNGQRQSKRLYFAYFIAQAKPVQKMFMLGTVCYFAYALLTSFVWPSLPTGNHSPEIATNESNDANIPAAGAELDGGPLREEAGSIDVLQKMYLDNLHLLTRHYWPRFFAIYNMSLSGRFITVLPPVFVISSRKEQGATHLEDERRIFFHFLNTISKSDVSLLLLFLLLPLALLFLVVAILYRLRWLATTDRTISGRHRLFFESLPVRFEGHNQEIECVACNTSWTVSACFGGEIRLWNNANGRSTAILKRTQDSATEETMSSDEMQVIHRKHQSQSKQQNGNACRASGLPWCLDISESFVAAGYEDGSVEIFSVPSGSFLWTVRNTSSGVTALALAESKKRLVLGRMDGSVDVYDIRTDSTPQLVCSRSLHHQPVSLVKRLEYLVVTGSLDRTLTVFRIDHPSSSICLHGHSDAVTALDVAAGAGELSTSVVSGSEDTTIRIWNADTGSCVRELTGHKDTILSVTCSGCVVASSSQDCQIRIWDRRTGECCHKLEQNHISWSILLLPNSCLTCSDRGSLNVYSCSSGQLLKRISFRDSRYCTDVRNVLPVSAVSALCSHGSVLYSATFPLVNSIAKT
ncbi:sterol regulatory element-binding protein cleavage-activating protein-like isoform X2 [Oscarella lobularis]|uniref:sterol regulatory element-binding protein cleavage-activating protein-like isoform X2 n=1 Tax=Oscarella lobularis TaxID=121494 RepID=UPI0033137997